MFLKWTAILLLAFACPVFAETPSDSLAKKAADEMEWRTPIRRLVVVVPIYREFYVENLGRLLFSLASQERSARVPLQIDVIFEVNNTQAVAPGIRVENQETVAFLKELAQGRMPKVRNEHVDLVRAATAVLASPVKLHVLDYTTPGFAERNIGKVRDIANKYALQLIPVEGDNFTVVAQMDGDCYVPTDYAVKIQSVFSRGQYTWAMLGLNYQVEPHSDPRVFQRHRVDSLDMAIWEFEAAAKNILPSSGSPRILMLASTLRSLGGVPHLIQGEDTQLVTNLKEKFGTTGTNIINLSVGTAYRARPDSYDGNIFLGRINWGTQIPEHLRQREKELQEWESKIEGWGPGWRDLLAQERHSYLQSMEVEASLLQSHALHALTALQSQREISGTHRQHALTRSNWWPAHLQQKLADANGDTAKALKLLIADFPDQLDRIPTDSGAYWVRFKAATNVVRFHQVSPNHFAAPMVPAMIPAPRLVTQPAPPGAPIVAPLVLRLNNSAATIQLHADWNVGFWSAPLVITNDTGVYRYAVNPQQPIHISEFNCANQLWVAGQLHFQHSQQNSVSALRRF